MRPTPEGIDERAYVEHPQDPPKNWGKGQRMKHWNSSAHTAYVSRKGPGKPLLITPRCGPIATYEFAKSVGFGTGWTATAKQVNCLSSSNPSVRSWEGPCYGWLNSGVLWKGWARRSLPRTHPARSSLRK
jgi:hypothetical protein